MRVRTGVSPLVLVLGRQAGAYPPGLPEEESGASYAFADDAGSVRAAVAEAEVVFHYGEPADGLSGAWPLARSVRWVHVAGVGVDWALFPALIESDVVVTNSRGIFDETMPEYALALMLALAKDLPGTLRAQSRGEWQHRLLEPLAGARAVIVGAGSIARSTGRLLRSMGMAVTLVARTEREGGPGEGRIRAVAGLAELLPEADWLVVIAPLTTETRGLIGARELGLLPRGARLVNIGRGAVVVEGALVEALRSGHLGGAALDVFEAEPLPVGHPLWSMPNVMVSPHIGGDVAGTPAAFTRLFLANLERYLSRAPLVNVVDKQLGYAPSEG